MPSARPNAQHSFNGALVKDIAELLATPLGQQMPVGLRHTGQLLYSNTIEPKKLSPPARTERLTG